MSTIVQADVAPSLRALLARSIDYAGMFPPATLELEPAVKAYLSYAKSPDAWMLSTFVLPVNKFAEAAWLISEFDEDFPFRISALGRKTINAVDFVEELKVTVHGIREFAGEYPKQVQINQLEMPLPRDLSPTVLSDAADLFSDLAISVFFEMPASEADQTVSLLANHNFQTSGPKFNFKLRTGGVTPDSFPSSEEIARVLVAVARDRVAVKFTAGLHHPIRMFRDEVKTKMHGFVNVLGAGVFAAEHGWSEQRTATMLEDEDADAFVFDDVVFRWREWEIGSAQIERQRQLITSFGSCSFDEPREDLRALKLL